MPTELRCALKRCDSFSPSDMYDPNNPNDPNFRLPAQCLWLKLNGSWPLAPLDQQRRTTYTVAGVCYRVWAWYVILSVGITISFQTAFLIGNFGDIMMTTENCCTTFMGILNFVRLLHLRLNQHAFKEILDLFVADIWIPDSMEPLIKADCNKRMNIYRIMTALLTCLILMYCVLPLVELYVLSADDGGNAYEKPFPYKMIFPYDAYRNGLRYACTYIFTTYAGICVVTTLFAEDSIFGFFITYTCGQYRILHKDIDRLIERAVRQHKNFSAEMLQRVYVRKQQLLANRHSRLIRFAHRLEDFFSPILLVNVVISTLLICMVGFQLAIGNNMFVGDYVKFVVYISSSLSQLYVLCSNGDMLIQHSSSTSLHLYACNWESGSCSGIAPLVVPDKEFRQNLEFMLLCSQRPVKITAMKFSTLSLESFTRILSTSMSYFTLLRTVYTNEQ